MRKLFLLLLAMATLSAPARAEDAAPSAQPPVNRPIRDKWALVVGIGKFQKSGIPSLQYAPKDAQDFSNFLVNEGHFARDHVRILLNEKATERRVMSELGSKFLARVAKPDDLVVLFFSTHGSPSQMDLRGKNYLVAYDSDPDDLFATGIEMQKIIDSIQGRVLTDRVLLVLDACHSGATGVKAKGMKRVANFDTQEIAEGSGQLVICSSQPEEQSWESRRYQNGVFTKHLLEGMRSNGKKATLSQAFGVTKQAVSDEVQEDHPGARQTPILNSKWNGNDLIVTLPPAAPQSLPDSVREGLEPDSSQVQLAAPVETAPTNPRSDAPSTTRTIDVRVPVQIASLQPILLNAAFFSNEADPKQALHDWGQAIANNPSDTTDYLFKRAKVLIQMGKLDAAFSDLKYALVDEPNNGDFYLARAWIFYCKGSLKQAEEDVKKAQFHKPTLPAQITFDKNPFARK